MPPGPCVLANTGVSQSSVFTAIALVAFLSLIVGSVLITLRRSEASAGRRLAFLSIGPLALALVLLSAGPTSIASATETDCFTSSGTTAPFTNTAPGAVTPLDDSNSPQPSAPSAAPTETASTTPSATATPTPTTCPIGSVDLDALDVGYMWPMAGYLGFTGIDESTWDQLKSLNATVIAREANSSEIDIEWSETVAGESIVRGTETLYLSSVAVAQTFDFREGAVVIIDPFEIQTATNEEKWQDFYDTATRAGVVDHAAATYVEVDKRDTNLVTLSITFTDECGMVQSRTIEWHQIYG